MTTYSPIQVTNGLTISAGQNLTFSGANGGLGAYQLYNASVLNVFGTVALDDTTANATLNGVTTGGTGAQPILWIKGGGTLTVNDQGSGSVAQGFNAAESAGFENDGTLSVSSAGGAFGVTFHAGGFFINSGAITVAGQNAYSYGFGSIGSVKATNSGSINVSGPGRVDGVNMDGGSFTNSGTIRATSTGGTSYGILAGDPGGGLTTIVNTGTVTADNVINSLVNTGPISVTNSGLLDGNVVLGTSAGNVVHNTGTITGDISFDGTSGQQTYDGRGGSVENGIFFASGAGVTGSDLVYLGDGGETVHGGAANLTVHGGLGADTIIGGGGNDYIEGGGGGDLVTGGLGADTFAYRQADGNLTVTDFAHAQGDKIDLTALDNVHTLAQVQALASQSGADTVVHFGGGGSLTLKNVALNSLTASDFAFNIAPGDFLGTGHASLFWQNSVNNLTSAWLLTDAAPASGVSLPAVSGWQTYDVGNFEGGAYGGDFLLRNTSTGMVDIWQDNAGTMSGHDVAKATLDWQIMGTADFNADGKSDILWRNEQNGYVSVWQMDGSTVSTTYNPGVVGLQWKLVAANDFYGDGKAEVLWRDPGTGEVNLWTIDGPGAGQTHGQTVAFLGNEWNVAGTGDFNGDGRADILWFDTVTGQVVLWEMNGPTVQAAQPIGDPGPQWRVVDVADISGDGKADILWRDTGTGQVVAWAMNGFNVDHYGVLGTVDNTWKVINHHYDWA